MKIVRFETSVKLMPQVEDHVLQQVHFYLRFKVRYQVWKKVWIRTRWEFKDQIYEKR